MEARELKCIIDIYIFKSDESDKLEVQRKVKIKHMNYIWGHSDNLTIFLVIIITVLPVAGLNGESSQNSVPPTAPLNSFWEPKLSPAPEWKARQVLMTFMVNRK